MLTLINPWTIVLIGFKAFKAFKIFKAFKAFKIFKAFKVKGLYGKMYFLQLQRRGLQDRERRSLLRWCRKGKASLAFT
ncbi:MAG: hypothetical protein LBH93_01295 [Chitinispirillales bacterium]|jgi:hypothetical protein|nr:hypothetical protein [Chitinispirillales bacterium]